jgi:TetR/AcrR family acrAB operon transcriptional repressor
MARKTKEDAAITREHLLDAAEQIFRQNGVTRTSLAEVAAAAGVTRGAVYWHFKDKAALFTAMCERATLPLDTMLDAARGKATDDPLGALRLLMVGALQHLARDQRTQAVFEIIFHKTEMSGELGAVANRRDRERCDCLVVVENLVEQAVSGGALPGDTDVKVVSQLINACMSGLMRDWVMDPSAFDLARSAPHFVASIVAGIVAQPPRVERVTAKTAGKIQASTTV